MTEQDRKDFNVALATLATLFEKALSKPLMDAYFDALTDLPLDSIRTAFQRVMASSKFFPKPVEIRELIEGNADDRANRAWDVFLSASGDVYASVRFFDAAMAAAMTAVFGSWISANQTLHECTPEMLAHYRNHFVRQYAVCRSNPRQDVDLHQVGLSEASMRRGEGDAGRTPILMQAVIFIGLEKSVSLRLPFDVAEGRLTGDAEAAIASGWAGLRAFALGCTRQTALQGAPAPKALPAVAGSEVPSIAERRRLIQEMTASLANRRAMSQPGSTVEQESAASSCALVAEYVE